jgi:nucleotide-binding universal stress UspA family protein
MRGPIVVGIDGSEVSRLALIEAGCLASRSSLDVVVALVRPARFNGVTCVFAMGAVAACLGGLDSDQALAYAESVTILDPLKIRWSFEVRTGQPARELMRAAEAHNANTIVIAECRHRTLGFLASQSVSAKLLHRWPHVLLVVHPPARGAMRTNSDSASGM